MLGPLTTYAGLTLRRLIASACCAFALCAMPGLAPEPAAARTDSVVSSPSILPRLDFNVEDNSDRSPPRERAARPANPLWAIPLSALSATRERPIFSPSRRPPPAAVVPRVQPVAAPPPPAPPAEPEPPPLQLVGTIVSAEGGLAVFIDRGSQMVVRLAAGDEHAGWTLANIEARAVTLRRGEQTELLGLPRPGDPPAPAGDPGTTRMESRTIPKSAPTGPQQRRPNIVHTPRGIETPNEINIFGPPLTE